MLSSEYLLCTFAMTDSPTGLDCITNARTVATTSGEVTSTVGAMVKEADSPPTPQPMRRGRCSPD
jgi:hypothetical protein